MVRLSRRLRGFVQVACSAALLGSFFAIPAVQAHNNPSFREDLIATVPVTCGADGCQDSAAFALTWEPKTVQLIWRVEGDPGAKAHFAVAQDGKTLAETVADGDATGRFEGKGIQIVGAAGFDANFTVKVYAKVLDRSAAAEGGKVVDTALLDRGKKVFESANCIGCHKWHGSGGGGYGGAALSLRQSALDDDQLRTVILCGRPNTGMPYHSRTAYKGDDTSCYDMTATQLGEMMPPKAPKSVSDRQLDALVYYLRHDVVGKGEPTLEECKAFWGDKSRMCSIYE
ncbi:hypothetical protein DLJ53_31275 [Acuticoccus sediminis]|uniref:Cytochrome c domain-containing protein n=1 Tax=Acuticoccus sediminis TaxID=2184697 RepID=A0A8B2NL20_9HYPH|nr:cytochrome c [Acuticoccus sediminis]RAH96747.1 hypothetical protein DLJ53_31275 [Acuticoccus sediminis]